MQYVNPPYPYGHDVPSLGDIRDTFNAFTIIDLGTQWYDVEYLRDDRTKSFVNNVKTNLMRQGFDLSMNRYDLIASIRADPPRLYQFLYTTLLDLYKFSLQNMDISLHTIDVSHAALLCSMVKWKTGGRYIISPRLHRIEDFDGDDEFLVVENEENGGVTGVECEEFRSVYKESEKVVIDRLSEHFGITISDLPAFLRSSTPNTGRERSIFAFLIDNRLAHVKKCVQYNGARLFISRALFELVQTLCRVLRVAERIMGI